MALVKKSESKSIFLEVKHYCLWQSIKVHEPACEEIEVNNPSTGLKVKKWGYRFREVTGRTTKLAKYDTGDKYGTRYFGFKLTLQDGADTYVLDMPYHSQILRRFLRVAPAVNWCLPLSIAIFKGKSKEGKKAGVEETGVWFRQAGETVKPYYTRDNPDGMPEATFDKDEQKWDFKPQHRWLVAKLQEETVPAIEAAAAKIAPPVQDLEQELANEPPPEEDEGPPPAWNKDHLSDDDVPF